MLWLENERSLAFSSITLSTQLLDGQFPNGPLKVMGKFGRTVTFEILDENQFMESIMVREKLLCTGISRFSKEFWHVRMRTSCN